MLAYFCFLEQLLVTRLGSGAISISLPCSCILGLLASMTSTTMVERKFAWLYATIQFGLVVLFAHLVYSLIPIPPYIEAVLSIVIATIAGFGGTMVGTYGLLGLFKVRGRRQSRSDRPQASQQVPQLHQLPETAHTPGTDSRSDTETMDLRIEHVS